MQLRHVAQIPEFRAVVRAKARFVEWSTENQVITSAAEFEHLTQGMVSALRGVVSAGQPLVVLHEHTTTHALAVEFAAMQLGAIVCPITWSAPYSRPMAAIDNLGKPKILGPSELEGVDKIKERDWNFLTFPAMRDDHLEGHATEFNEERALIVTTSGTSGHPKGVILSHRAVTATLLSALAVSPIEKGHTVLSFLPNSHILERMMLYVAMASGADIHFALDPKHAFAIARKVRPHYMATVPRTLERVVSAFSMRAERKGYFKRSVFQWSMQRGQSSHPFSQWLASKIALRHMKRVFGRKIKGILVGGAGIDTSVLKQFHSAGLEVRTGYGLTEACGLVSINRFTPGGNTLGSVGLPLPGVQVKTVAVDGELGEVYVKSEGLLDAYIDKGIIIPEKLESGWLPTGDLGYVDDRGFLFVVGRLRNTFKNSYAQYVAPERIERSMRALPGIDHCMIIGNSRPFTSALLLPDFEWLKLWCVDNGVHWTAREYMIFNPEVLHLYQQKIDKVNSDLPGHESIHKFALVHESWDVVSGLVTATLKIKRNDLLEFYKKRIDEIYDS